MNRRFSGSTRISSPKINIYYISNLHSRQCPETDTKKDCDGQEYHNVPDFPGVQSCGGKCIVATDRTVHGKMPESQRIKVLVSAICAAHFSPPGSNSIFFRRYGRRTGTGASEPAAKPQAFKTYIFQCPDAIYQEGKDCNDNDSVPDFPGVKSCSGKGVVAAYGAVYDKMPDRQGVEILVSAVRTAHLFILPPEAAFLLTGLL